MKVSLSLSQIQRNNSIFKKVHDVLGHPVHLTKAITVHPTASSENKNKKSMVFILYKRSVIAKISSSNFTPTGCLILEMAESE